MDIPTPDPQHAPLHEVHLFEILRHRYLEQARAVANIDVYDLILPTQAACVFDQAQDASQGVLTLAGQMSFPWRPKSKKSVQFGDHAYVQFDGTNLKRRWVTAPAKNPDGTLTQSEFHQPNRDRKNVLVYRRKSKNILPNAARNIALPDFAARLNCAVPPAKHNIL